MYFRISIAGTKYTSVINVVDPSQALNVLDTLNEGSRYDFEMGYVPETEVKEIYNSQIKVIKLIQRIADRQQKYGMEGLQ